MRRGKELTFTEITATGDTAMIQPYLPTIETEGETSLLFFGGRFSHAVNKRPVTGEFRIQLQYGGIYTPVPTPPAGALALAEQTLAAIDAPLLYARIDMVRDDDGSPRLMELEIIEPRAGQVDRARQILRLDADALASRNPIDARNSQAQSAHRNIGVDHRDGRP